MFRNFRSEIQEFDTLGFAPQGRALGRGGVLPPSLGQVETVDLVRQIDVDHFMNARPGTGGGGGGGGGGGTTFSPYTSGPADAAAGFNITIIFQGTWTQALYDIFVAAADFYTALIVGDLQDVTVTSGRGKRATTTNVDDITITASLTNIDGSGGVLGRAGPTAVRTDGSLPATAIMEFDISDANDFNALGLFDDIVVHEMAHTLGFGTIWDRLGLINADNTFAGPEAQAASLIEFGTSAIQVETDGGQGTAFGHWDEDTYLNELMSGFIDNPNYFSDMSAASFADLGYELAENWRIVVDNYNIA